MLAVVVVPRLGVRVRVQWHHAVKDWELRRQGTLADGALSVHTQCFTEFTANKQSRELTGCADKVRAVDTHTLAPRCVVSLPTPRVNAGLFVCIGHVCAFVPARLCICHTCVCLCVCLCV